MSLLVRRLRQVGKALRLLPDPVYRHGLRHGVGASIEHQSVVAALRVATLVDVGANVGQFSLLVRKLHPDAQVFAFEPLAAAAARYRALFAGMPGVTLHQAALAPETGRATMHVSASADSSSLLPISDRQTEMFPGTAEVGTEEVRTGPLDAFVAPADIREPALLKIDVQGFELEVLHGCASLLDRFDHVYVEASFVALYEGQALADEVISYLESSGFELAGRHNESRDARGQLVQADFLFRRRALSC